MLWLQRVPLEPWSWVSGKQWYQVLYFLSLVLREKQSRSVLLCTPCSWTAGGDDPESC